MPAPMAPENPMLAPGHVAYSPAHAVIADGLDTFEAFERERRDEAFAGRREQFLREHVAAVLARHHPAMEIAAIECRNGSCLIVLDAPAEPWSTTLANAVGWGRVHEVRVGEPIDGRVTIEVAALMDRELLDHATYERYLRDWRQRVAPDLDALRASLAAP